ncbi:MAG TPA: SBBP repeat-containing protein, partial [Bryobacteraceae bacterium]
MIRVSVVSALIAGGLLSAAPMPRPFHRPLTFEPNQGQAPAEFRWLGQSSSYQVLLDGDSATIVIPDKTDLQAASARLPGTRPRFRLKYSAVRMKLAGGRPWRDLSGSEPTGGVSNYLNGRDLKRSVNHVRQYKRVKVANVYKGIDLIFYNNGDDLEYDFAVAPGANPEQIQVAFEGTKEMRVDPKSGDLIVTLPGGAEIRQLAPKVYQQVGDKRLKIAGGYRLLEPQRAAFRVAGYDRSYALIIDPTLKIARSFDGSQDDVANAIAVDDNGNTYITGSTFSLNFPVTNNSVFQHPHSCGSFPFDPSFCGSLASDIFVAKVTSDGSIGFVTYDGVGSGNGIAVDSSGIYVTGEAIPPDGDIIVGFPFVNNAGDLFVQRMSLDGQSLYYTIAGGPGHGFGIGHDAGNGIALDDLHNAWAVGVTDRDDSGKVHVLLVKIAPDGSELVERAFSSDGNDVGFGVAVAARQPWLTGQTCGSGFPTSDGIVHHPNHCAVFVLHQDEAGNDLMGMVFGGDGADDGGIAIVTNGSNAAFVTGFTNNSFNFPRTTLGLDAAFVFSLPMGFVTEVTAIGASPGTIIRSATITATNGFVRPTGIATDNKTDGIYISGVTNSPSFPRAVTPGPNSANMGFVMKVPHDFSQILYSVLLGQTLTGVAARQSAPVFPEIYVAGFEHVASSQEAFMVKMIEDTPTSFVTNTAVEVNTNPFTVSWGGSSSVSSALTFDVFVSDNGGPFTPFLTATTATSAPFTGVPGHTYGFFSIATDAAGNKEPMKTRADFTVKIADITPPLITPQITGTLGNNGWYRSAVIVNWSVSDPESGIASSTG